MITINGSPKTGTHLLQKAVVLFGVDYLLTKYTHSLDEKEIEGKHLHIIRNPRNVLISWMRFNKNNFNEKDIINTIPSIIKEMKEYTKWLDDKNVFNTKFEILLTDPNELIKIGKFLGEKPIDNHFKLIWGGTKTFTNSLSNWREYWSDSIGIAWEKSGGLELENVLGYNIDDNYVRLAQ